MRSTLAAYDKAAFSWSPVQCAAVPNGPKVLGLLRKLGALAQGAGNPLVGIIKQRPTKVDDLEILERCNVAITTIAALKDMTSAASDDEAEDDEGDDGRETADVEGSTCTKRSPSASTC